MRIFGVIAVLMVVSCSKAIDQNLNVESPNSEIKVNFNLSDTGEPFYMVEFKNKVVVDTSYLSFDFLNAESLKSSLMVIASERSVINESWEMPWGEQLQVSNSYNELNIQLQESSELSRRINLVFRVYDDGIGFRYEFPEQDSWDEAQITEEHTEFNLTEDYKTFWIPGDWDIYEHLYSTTKLSEIDAISYIERTNLAQSYIPDNAVNTPVTMVGSDGTHLSFHEAALVDYAGMTLKVSLLDRRIVRQKSLLSCHFKRHGVPSKSQIMHLH